VTLKGEIVEVGCFTKMGVVESSGKAHVACAKHCVASGEALGILTDHDGLITITGDFAAAHYKKLLPYIGKQVEVRGVNDRSLEPSPAIRVVKVAQLKK
jgi:hypothetical protein